VRRRQLRWCTWARAVVVAVALALAATGVAVAVAATGVAAAACGHRLVPRLPRRRDAGEGSAEPRRKRCSHSDAPLYVALVIIYRQYTGVRQNDRNV
jgi:hypothetical protein